LCSLKNKEIRWHANPNICRSNFLGIEFAAFLELAKLERQMKGKVHQRLLHLTLVVLSFGFIQTSQNPNSIAVKALHRMDYMEYNQAIQYLNLILLVDPKIENVRTKLGFCYYRIREYEKAIKTLREEIFYFPENLDAFIYLSYILFKQKRYQEAERTCLAFSNRLDERIHRRLKIIYKAYGLSDENVKAFYTNLKQENPNLGLPYFILGICQKKNSDSEDAKSNYEMAKFFGYESAECNKQLIDIEICQNNLDKALAMAEYTRTNLGENGEYLFLLGYIYYQQGETEKAINAFNRSVEQKPYLIETMKNLARICYNDAAFENTAILCHRLLKITPYDYEARFLYENSIKAQSREITAYTKKVELSKEIVNDVSLKFRYTIKKNINAIIHYINSQALTKVRLGQKDRAIQLIEKFLEINDQSPELNYNLAQIYDMNNNLQKAMKYAWRSIEIKKDYRDAYDLIGNIFFKMADYDTSIQFYRKALAINPNDAWAHYNLGCAYMAKKDFKNAEISWKSALRHEKTDREEREEKSSENKLNISIIVISRRIAFHSHRSLGLLYVKQNRTEEALNEFQLALKLEPNEPEPHYEIGKIYQKMSEENEEYVAKAIFYYEKYLYLGGKKEQKARRLLESLK